MSNSKVAIKYAWIKQHHPLCITDHTDDTRQNTDSSEIQFILNYIHKPVAKETQTMFTAPYLKNRNKVQSAEPLSSDEPSSLLHGAAQTVCHEQDDFRNSYIEIQRHKLLL
jgi:SH3-like domain-containing protein